MQIFNSLSLRVTLLLLEISVGEIPAGTDCDLQTGGVGVVGQSQLQLSGHADALEEAAVCADAAVAALRRQNTGCSFPVCDADISKSTEHAEKALT